MQALSSQAAVDACSQRLDSARSGEQKSAQAAEAADTKTALAAWAVAAAEAEAAQASRAARELRARASEASRVLAVAQDVLRVGEFVFGTALPAANRAADFLARHSTDEILAQCKRRAAGWLEERARREVMRCQCVPAELRGVADGLARAAMAGELTPEQLRSAAVSVGVHFTPVRRAGPPVMCAWARHVLVLTTPFPTTCSPATASSLVRSSRGHPSTPPPCSRRSRRTH